MQEKICFRCKKLLEISMFGKEKQTKDGLRSSCKDCLAYTKKVAIDKRKTRTDEELFSIIKRLYPNGHKECRDCNSSVPIKTGWNIDRQREDGLTIYCKYCLENRHKKWDGRKRVNNRVKQKYLATEEERKRNDAALAVCYAVRMGQLSKPDICCICNQNGKINAHHYDYSQLLTTFVWVCVNCHSDIHHGKYSDLLPPELKIKQYSKLRDLE